MDKNSIELESVIYCNMDKFILYCTILLLSTNLYAKQKPVLPILEKISSIKGSVQIQNLFVDNWVQIDDLPVSFKNSVQNLIKTNNGIFLNIDGTGRIYKYISNGRTYEFIRIDSTYYTGYNFGSILFNHKENIYSFGGEGFWNTNGDLRIFDNSISHEWHARKLNKLIHGSFSGNDKVSQFYFFDEQNHRLIISGPTYTQSHVLMNPKIDSSNIKVLYQLDILSGKWSTFGIKKFESNQRLALTPYGIANDEFFVDILRNKIYKQKVNVINLIFSKSIGDNKVSITFCKDSILYFGNSTGEYDSILISRQNLIDTGNPAYYSIENTNILPSKLYILLISIIGVLLLSFLFIFKNQIKKKKISSIENTDLNKVKVLKSELNVSENPDFNNIPIYRSGKLIELISEQELIFLKYLYDNSMDERMTTIEEINKKLGTTNKTVEIQKKMRSDMINGINLKLAPFSKSSRPVIHKLRSEFDKRSFEYYIHPENMDLSLNIININKP